MKITLSLLFTILLFLFTTEAVLAQEFSFDKLSYYQRELHINPAYAGTKNSFSTTINVQKQWAGIDKSPSVQRLQVHSPFSDNKIGLGLTLYNETYGVTHSFGFSTYYAYKIPLEKGILSLGLSLGAKTYQEKFADLETPMPDPVFSENTSLMWGPSCGVGVYFSDNDSENYYVGFSMPVLIDNSLKEGGGKLANKIDVEKIPFCLTGGYVFPMGESFRLKSAALVSYSNQYKFAYNVNLTAYYKHNFWVGGVARYNKQAGMLLGINALDYVALNYTLTLSYGNIMSKVGQSAIHEISLRFELDFKGKRAAFKYF